MCLVHLLNKHAVSESPLKADLLSLARTGINRSLASRGIGPAFEENWIAVQSGNYTVISGSAAKTPTDIYGFLFVFAREAGMPYYEIGTDSTGQMPPGFSLLDSPMCESVRRK
jgi:hypothetical protein